MAETIYDITVRYRMLPPSNSVCCVVVGSEARRGEARRGSSLHFAIMPHTETNLLGNVIHPYKGWKILIRQFLYSSHVQESLCLLRIRQRYDSTSMTATHHIYPTTINFSSPPLFPHRISTREDNHALAVSASSDAVWKCNIYNFT